MSALAADSYYWVDSGDHDLMNRSNWRLSNTTGSVPETWPPALDTATTGSTHPYIYVPTSATLALPNHASITLNDLIFNTAGTDSVIDLGSKEKTIKLFGNCDSALWVGQNNPDGERVTLKSGMIMNAAASQRNLAIRLGGAMTTDKRMSGFSVDGPDAVVSNLMVNISSPACEFVVTNGGKAYVGGGNYAIRMNQRMKGSAVRVSGAGSVLHHLTRGNTCFMFGDNITNPDTTSGGLEITDGGVVTNANGAIGNRAGNFYVKMDDGTWEGQTLTLGAAGAGTSTNNTLTARNGSRLAFTSSVGIGTWGGLSSALIESSELVTPTLSIGGRGVGYGYSEMTLTNATFDVSTVYVGGSNGDGPNACNNTLTIRDSIARSKTGFYVSCRTGGGATNHLVLADSTLALGDIYVGPDNHGGCNTVLVTNCTLSASFQIGGSASASSSGSSGNAIRIVDSTLGSPAERTTTFEIANGYTDCPSRSNRVELVRSTWYNKATYLGVGGWPGSTNNKQGNDGNAMILDDHSLVVCTNGSKFYASDLLGLGIEGVHRAYTGTNVVYVGKNSEVISTGFLHAAPGGNAFVIDDGLLAPRYLQLHYFYSEAQGKTLDGMAAAEAEYGKTAKEIWGTRFVFKGSHPVLRCPGPIATITNTSGCGFDRSCIVSFEFPEEPYAQPPLQSSQSVSFADGTTVEFDLSKVGIAGGSYVLADQTESGSLTVSATQLAKMQEALDAAAKAVERRARIFVDGKKLVVKVSNKYGLLLIVR